MGDEGRPVAAISGIPPREQLMPASLGAFHKSEIEKWCPLIKAADIRIE